MGLVQSADLFIGRELNIMLIGASDYVLEDYSRVSAWLKRTAQEQEHWSSSDGENDGSSGSSPRELVDCSSDDEVVLPMVRASRIKTFRKKRHERKPTITRADRPSNCWFFPVADEGGEVADQDQRGPKRHTTPKRPPGECWFSRKVVQESARTSTINPASIAASGQVDIGPGESSSRSSGDTC